MRTLVVNPKRKSGNVNKRYKEYAETSPEKNVGTSDKRHAQKRKLCDTSLGPQWSKDELERFYGAYRKYGKEWNKVASVVRKRTFEMVQALYNMNRAYLSLPDGTASVAGLIAMMSDHYNVQERNGSDIESNDAPRVHSKPKKHRHESVPLCFSKGDLLQSPPIPPNNGCLSFLRRPSNGCTVKKRTPRIPVNSSPTNDSSGNYISSSKKGRKIEMDENVTHMAALVLTQASQNGGGQPISQSPSRTAHTKLFPPMSQGKKSNPVSTKLRGTFKDDENVGIVEVYQKGRKINGKGENIENIRTNRFDGGLKVCKGTGKGLFIRHVREKFGTEVMNEKSERSSLGKRKRNKELFYGGGNSEMEALDMLAEVSLLMPDSLVESESSTALNKDTPVGLTDRPTNVQADSKTRKGSKKSLLHSRGKINHTFFGKDTCMSENNELGSGPGLDFITFLPEGKQQAQPITKSEKKKHNSLSLMDSEVPDHASFCANKPMNTGAFAEEKENLVNEVKCASHDFSASKQEKLVGDVDFSSSNCDMIKKGPDSTVSPALSLTLADAGSPPKRRSRRKTDPKILAIRNGNKLHEFISKERLDKLSTVHDGSLYLKDKVSFCLSSYMVRKWCTFEWFYSKIDYPWFAKREFDEYLNHVGLGHIPRLTRVEWGVVKSSLGKARRFSENFLRKEREKLKNYRESVRKHYTELRNGVKEGLPTDLARPLSVGQRVIAIHPKSREVHNGSVLSVDHDKCMIQFNRPELGVEIVMDIDCMPSDPVDNMPEAMRRQHNSVNLSFANSRGIMQSAGGRSTERVPADILGNVQSSKETCLRQGKVSSALLNLGQHNTCPVSSLRHANSVGGIKSLGSFSVNNQEPGSRVFGILNESKLEARTMVDTAIQAISKLKAGQNALANVREALNSSDQFKSPPDCGSSVIRSLGLVNGGSTHNLLESKSDLVRNNNASDPKQRSESDGTETQIPSELIASCTATCLMIKMCTERQCPPSDVAQILDSAVSSLYPRCSQNLPIYRDIEMHIRRVKTQILSLVPT